MNKFFKLLLAFMAISIAQAHAQQVISGKVLDEQKQPLPYVNVVLLSLPDSTFVTGTTSDEKGMFSLSGQMQGRLLRISSVGYTTVYRICKVGDMGIVSMMPDARLLGEVVVRGNLPVTRAKGDAMITTVAGSVLEKAGSGNQLLDKIPNVSAENGKVNVFGRGTAVVYVNGRRMRNASELEQLSSDDIQAVEVVSNPGARYDADAKAVVRIVTKKKQGDGFGFRNVTGVSYKYDWSENEQVDLNWRKGGLDLSGRLIANNVYNTFKKELVQDSHLENHWQQRSDFVNNVHSQNFMGMLSANYQVNERHSLGVRYEYSRKPKGTIDTDMDTEVSCDGDFYEQTATTMHSNGRNYSHSLNLYYVGKLKDWTLDFNADGSWGKNKEPAIARESTRGVEENDERTVTSLSRYDNTLYAAKLVPSHPLAGGEVSVGSEYTYTDRTNFYQNEEGILSGDDSEIKEDALALFADYSRRFGKVYAQAGIRYEHISSDYYEQSERVEEQSRTYDHVFPSASLSFPVKKVQVQFSYRASISRPRYSMLRGNIYYANRYTYEGGNPLLRPALMQDLSMNVAYRWISLYVGFSHNKDASTAYTRAYSDELPTVGINTFKNVDAYNEVNASLNLSPTVGIWSPRWNLNFSQAWFPAETPQGRREFNHPLGAFSWRNGFSLPGDFRLDADMHYMTAGHSGNIELLKDRWWANLTLGKSFLKERLSLQCVVVDVFNTRRSPLMVYSGVRTAMHNEHMRRSFSFTLRYNFNAAKSKYKGTGAGTAQKRRM